MYWRKIRGHASALKRAMNDHGAGVVISHKLALAIHEDLLRHERMEGILSDPEYRGHAERKLGRRALAQDLKESLAGPAERPQ